MSSHLSKFHVCQIFFWVVASHAAVPTIPNGVYDQTTITPFTIGSCTGEGAGCSGVYGMSWLSDGRMVLLTSDYQQHGQMPYPGHPRSKVTLLSGLTGGGSVLQRLLFFDPLLLWLLLQIPVQLVEIVIVVTPLRTVTRCDGIP